PPPKESVLFLLSRWRAPSPQGGRCSISPPAAGEESGALVVRDAIDRLEERAYAEGLRKDRRRPERARFLLHVARTGDDHQRDRRERGIPRLLLPEPAAVHVGHPEVQKDDVGA